MTTQGHTVTRDQDGDWLVIDAAGEMVEYFADKAGALARAAELDDEAEVERLNETIGERIAEAYLDSDLDTLRRVAAILGL